MAVVGYQVRIKKKTDGAWGSWVDVGNVLTHRFTGFEAGTQYLAHPRAYDAVPNYSAAPSPASATTDAAPFAPDQISGLVQWLEAGRVTGVSSGDPLPTWEDLSSAGNDATRVLTDSYPKWVVGGNGAAYVDFEGGSTGNFYDAGDFSALTEGEVFIVLRGAADPSATGLETGLWTYGTSGSAALHPWTNGSVYEGFGSTVRKTTGNPTPSLTDWHSWNVWSAASDFGVRLNGSAFYSTASNTVGFSSACALGRSAETARRWGGEIAAMCIFGRKLTTGERALMDAYIAAIIAELTA